MPTLSALISFAMDAIVRPSRTAVVTSRSLTVSLLGLGPEEKLSLTTTCWQGYYPYSPKPTRATYFTLLVVEAACPIEIIRQTYLDAASALKFSSLRISKIVVFMLSDILGGIISLRALINSTEPSLSIRY